MYLGTYLSSAQHFCCLPVSAHSVLTTIVELLYEYFFQPYVSRMTEHMERPASLDIEELVRASKLCEACCSIFASVQPGLWPMHQPSCDSLCRSAEAGCVICTILYEEWQLFQKSSRSYHEVAQSHYFGGISFHYCVGDDVEYLKFMAMPSDTLRSHKGLRPRFILSLIIQNRK